MPSVPPETPPQPLLRSVEAFSRALRESSLGVAREIGCSKGTLAIVRILQRRGTLQVSDIAHALRVDISVASRQVSQLVDDGLVERTVDDGDRRVRTIRLSPAGRSLARRDRRRPGPARRTRCSPTGRAERPAPTPPRPSTGSRPPPLARPTHRARRRRPHRPPDDLPPARQHHESETMSSTTAPEPTSTAETSSSAPRR